jgi:hypothetical protein
MVTKNKLLLLLLFFQSLYMTGVLQVFAAPVIATVRVESVPLGFGSGVTLRHDHQQRLRSD